VLGSELLRAMVPNDGSVSATTMEPGAAVCLHLPPDALRVLTMNEAEEQGEANRARADGDRSPPNGG